MSCSVSDILKRCKGFLKKLRMGPRKNVDLEQVARRLLYVKIHKENLAYREIGACFKIYFARMYEVLNIVADAMMLPLDQLYIKDCSKAGFAVKRTPICLSGGERGFESFVREMNKIFRENPVLSPGQGRKPIIYVCINIFTRLCFQ